MAKKILGLDLGTTSIGWAIVNEAQTENEKSEIIKLGVRVNPLTVDEQLKFEKGQSITTNADRTLKRSMRRNLQRFKLRKEQLIEVLKENGFITDLTLLSENGNASTFETYRLRAKAATEKINLEELGRVFLMINKKRGYKSSRKAKTQEEGQLIDGMEIAKKLYEAKLSPGQYVYASLKNGKNYVPDFYRSDLQLEFDTIWNLQSQFYADVLTPEAYQKVKGQKKKATSDYFNKVLKILTPELKGNFTDKRLARYAFRDKAIRQQLTLGEVAEALCEINGNLADSSGYLGAISDRSKELFFNKETVGQYLMRQLNEEPHTRLKNQVFYRQDYLDEFNRIWETQREHHPTLTDELKTEIRDVIIFYQRRLKSQKGLISFCELESKVSYLMIDGKKKTKTIGKRVCPKSSPLFQEFKIWQGLNNLTLTNKSIGEKRTLHLEEKEILAKELYIKDKLQKTEVLKLLFENPKDLDLNFKEVEGHRTSAALYKSYQQIIELSGYEGFDFSKMKAEKIKEVVTDIFKTLGYNTNILNFNSDLDGKLLEQHDSYQLWHLLYSFEGDNTATGSGNLIQKLTEKFGFAKEHAIIVANTVLQPDYGSLSSKAMRNLLPHLKEGNDYSVACTLAGYNHSKDSLTLADKEKKTYKDKLDILPKNSLRNPVVEKILNQMINVVNTLIETYGKPDEIRIELARELKKSTQEREDLTKAIAKSTAEHEKYRSILQQDFGLSHVSKNDIIRYKLYLELEHRNFKTLYSNTYIAPNKLFSKEFDIEHIIPTSRLFDDSFSNKTLESRSVNLEKANETAYDYIQSKLGETGLSEYLKGVEDLYKAFKISKTKYTKLKMSGATIPENIIDRELRNTQYIAKKAKAILEDLVKDVVSTGGSVTSRLREDWQLVDVMQELNWDKYDKLGLTNVIENREGHKLRRITNWTKRNDHRHHAMDALTIAFTKLSFIQYLNNLNARSDKSKSILGIEDKELERNAHNKLVFKSPIPLKEFRAEAKKHLENTLVSFKGKNKVTTRNTNITKKTKGITKCVQKTPRGQLHLETVYGSIQQYLTKEEKVGANFNEEKIAQVAHKKTREALLSRLKEWDNDPKKAFTGKNSLDKNPLYLDAGQNYKVPLKVKTVTQETVYTIRKEINPDLKIEKVVDPKIRELLTTRLNENNNDPKKAFANLNENPIWLNKEKGICIKRVTITGVSNAISLHSKKDKEGRLVLDKNGNTIPVDFVNTGNNHHVAIYKDENGELQENVVSFFEATARVNLGLPVIDKTYKSSEGWVFLYSMKQNEYFIFPNESTGFKPSEIDLLNPENYALISPNLFRVQKLATKNYFFRHHLETTVEAEKELKGITYKIIQSTKNLQDIIKVRVNHIGQIVSLGEY